MDQYIVEMNEINKRFGEVHAVKDCKFTLRKGEIHSLIGENGTGKSTMMKLLYGIFPIDSGTIKINGNKIENLTPSIAIQNGIGMVHQEFMLVDELTVLENIILGFEPRKRVTIDFQKAKIEIQKYIDDYHMDIQLNKKINQISVGEAQRVEIIKTLYRGAEILILDEPTAVLTPIETEKFFEILEDLKRDGKSIVFISHKLDEVMKISDRITVMRQGEYKSTLDKHHTNPAELARLMVGRDILLDVRKEVLPVGEKILEVKDLWTSGEKELSKIRGIDLKVYVGEIVGIAGIDGNGQSELIEAITGLRKVERGDVLLKGKSIANLSPKKIRERGISHIPEDRNLRGLNRNLSIMDNMIATSIDSFSKGILLNKKAIEKHTVKLIEAFDVRPNDPHYMTQSLSGGNAQKIVVAREVSEKSDLLIATQPTRGVDIGAIESIRAILNEVKKQNRGILLVSADLDEILSLSDRVIVMYEGKISGEVSYREANRSTVGDLMMGGSDIVNSTNQKKEVAHP